MSGVCHFTESVMGPEKQSSGSGIVLDQQQTKFIVIHTTLPHAAVIWCKLTSEDYRVAWKLPERLCILLDQ